MAENNEKNKIPRPPIVVVMGHVDHGKTTLLDYIRKTTIASGEAGGITQSIGAYEIEHGGKKITFIDTPGHEAFSRMRQRGAKAADLAILVVAADDGVQPQTKEVIQVLKETQTPFVVALNKIDKNNADPERVKSELAKAEVLLEGYGGNVSWQGISAKTGEGVNELLDLILLAAELEGLTYNPEAPGSGFVIEAKMDSQRGMTAMGIVKDGILKVGDEIKTRTAGGKVKILENFLGERVQELTPSSPVLILGFDKLPETGEEFISGQGELSEIPGSAQKASQEKHEPGDGHLLHAFLKADVSGSLEAVSQIVRALPEVHVVAEGIGEITDGDVKEAFSKSAIILGFNVGIAKSAENLAKTQESEIITSDIIYDLVKKLQEKIESVKKPAPLGELEVLKTFSQKGRKQVIGGRVLYGAMKSNAQIEIRRGEEVVGMGRIVNLQKGKEDCVSVGKDEECGIMFDSDVVVGVGDHLVHEA